MKNLSLSEKIIFFVNTLVAFIFLFSLIIPFIPPRDFFISLCDWLVYSHFNYIEFYFYFFLDLQVKKTVFFITICSYNWAFYITEFYKFF